MINRVYNALTSIQRIYLKYPAIGKIEKYGERVFAYEFYHQLRIRFNDLHLNITGEPIKGAGLLPDMKQTIIPDFVIHNYATNDHNEIAIEIKVTPNLNASQIRNDLQKLANMIKGPLRYKQGIFFAGNCDVLTRINGSFKFYNEIVQILENNPNIIIWYTLPFDEGTDMTDCISKSEIKSISHKNFL